MMTDERLVELARRVALFGNGDTGALTYHDAAELLAEVYELRAQVNHLIIVQHEARAQLWAVTGGGGHRPVTRGGAPC